MADPTPTKDTLDPKLFFVTSVLAAVVATGAFFALGQGPALLPFVGRFHPLFVHLPIGVLLLAVTLEVLGFGSEDRRKRLDAAMGAVLGFLVVSAVVAFAVGLLLGRAGDYPQKLLAKHRTLTFVSVLGACATLASFAAHKGKGLPRGMYRAVLGLTVGAMSLGGHVGGSLSRGEGYLFQLAPSFVQTLAGYTPPKKAEEAAPAKAAEPLVWDAVVLPALKERCGACHGEEKKKGGLRVDSIEALLKGGLTGPAIVPFASDKSLLVERMKLPKDSDDHMPPDDKPSLSPAELAALTFFIDRGAPKDLKVRDALAPEAARTALEKATAK